MVALSSVQSPFLFKALPSWHQLWALELTLPALNKRCSLVLACRLGGSCYDQSS